ncbi:fungal-specific transcription factor domain-domain-containing protein [Clohesyomyces aquaticus]|uniref:Fungal-specific transcription factor domain-domain-containing protein n=1 Tax=Clohesyomyces aquaticus TaxID=1231657 RepID=A0A1Y1YW75_9PLEO|nr:fungal-specific transcription factor domain-domain-containing protein [Clohesyomyces aquaticus]
MLGPSLIGNPTPKLPIWTALSHKQASMSVTRKFTCIYSDRDAPSPSDGRPTKKRALDEGDVDTPGANDLSASNTPSNGVPAHSPLPRLIQASSFTQPHSNFSALESRSNLVNVKHEENALQAPDERPTVEAAARSLQQFATGQSLEEQPSLMSRGSTVQSGQDEEAVVYTQSRMLQDPTGRLLYVGDSATLSFLQLLRMMVENVAGTSPFTNDPRRHKIVEGQFSLPSGARHTHLLPDHHTARVLVDAFFINTHGFLQVFDHEKFLQELERCYSDPLSTEPSWLCLLNLVFAIGLVMATPLSGSEEALIIDKLRSEHLDRAEVFYLNAKSLNDPLMGFEEEDFWSIQALLLMSVYMLAKSKRNTAFALLGMAARSAHALGLHREETMIIFSPEDQTARKNLWRSIFVVDRLLSCSLGRPTAISEDDCSGDTLRPADPPPESSFNPNMSTRATLSETGVCALEAAIRSCSVIGVILRKVYQQRKISTRLAQEIADICKTWPRALPPSLHWRQAANATPSQGVAILHVNLFYCHSIILLTRPFFLYILNLETQRQINQATTGNGGRRPASRMEKFSEACVIASTHTILLVQNAFDAGYLSRRNPAVIYFLFAAALVILANEFAALYRVDASDTCILNAINIMSYCAESDQQASRLVYIMTSFRDVVAAQRARRKQNQPEIINLPSISSQLYGVPMPNQQQNATGMAEPVNSTPRLHQVPIHIYPGMQTTPLPNDGTHHYRSESQPPMPSLPVLHLSPIHNTPAPTTTSTEQFTLNPLSKPPSLSNVLDLSALDAGRAPSMYSEEGSGQDEHIDFDALWAWPSNTPALGTPRIQGDGEMNGNVFDRIQGVSDSAVPLFGVVRTEGME